MVLMKMVQFKIKESRVKEEDYYLDLNASASGSSSVKENKTNNASATPNANHSSHKFEIISSKCHPTLGSVNSTRSKKEKTDTLSSLSNQAQDSTATTAAYDHESNASKDLLASTLLASLSSSLIKAQHTNANISANLSVAASSLSSSSSSVSSPMLSSNSSMCSTPSPSPTPSSHVVNNASKKTRLDMCDALEEARDEDAVTNGTPTPAPKSANQSFDDEERGGEASSANGNVTVFNRPKQYFGSLYEPDKQYSCKLCTYTTNHKPSMEDHVYVHTNKRPYR